MTDAPKKPLPVSKIRTFAEDLKKQRDKQNNLEKEEELTEDKEPLNEEVVVSKTSNFPKPERKPIPIPKITPKKKPEIKIPEKVEPSQVTQVKKSTIPAYHELQKKIDSIEDNTKDKKPKPVAPIKATSQKEGKNIKKEVPKKPNLGYEATIITDTKKHNPDFFPTIIEAISAWFQKILTPKPKKAPKYTVADSSTRKGVIQKATTKTGSIFTSDSDSLKEQIRKRRLAEINESNSVEADEPETVWSPYTETGYDLLDAPDLEQDTKPIEPPLPPAPIEEPIPETPKPAPPIIYKPEIEDNDLDDQRWNNKEEIETVSKKPEPEPKPEIKPEETNTTQKKELVSPVQTNPEPDDLETEALPEKAPEIADEETPPEEKESMFSNYIDKIDTNTLSVLVLMILIGLVSLILVGRLVYQYVNVSLIENSATQVSLAPLLKNSTISNLTVSSGEVNDLPLQIDQARINTDEPILEIILVDETGKELAPSEIFALLDFSVTPIMEQSVNQVRFLSLDQKEEVLLLNYNDEESVKGSFLQWEEDLTNDLQPLYTAKLPDSNFIDSQLSGIDTREIISEDNTVLIYSLINENTALISTNKSDLERIINLEF